ncbi:hypothetical protein AB0C93_09970 [Streptomyces sp. NPDC048518]|uniref:hypothetical protein n=1 Tax=Streptomyces sp. NPDC048518 TaxID=3155029 RepID=UPI0033E156CD
MSHSEQPGPADLVVSDRFYLRVLDRFADDEDIAFLALGLRLMAQRAPAVGGSSSEPIGIHVHELDYLPTDHQPEAAALALMEWFGAEFDVEVPQVGIAFDRASGYTVEWPDGH